MTGTIAPSKMKITCTGRADNHIGSMIVRRTDGYNPLLSCITMAAKMEQRCSNGYTKTVIARQNKYIAGLDDRRLVGYDVTYSDDGAHIRPPPSDVR